MATQPTNFPVASETPRDLKFNAGKIDEFVTSLQRIYKDRFGQEHYTIEGLRWVAQQAIAAFGYVTLKSFQLGAPLPNNELTLPNQVLQDEANGEYYRWDGTLPKSVPAGSTPENTGGIGVGKWISVGDASLRTELLSTSGASIIGSSSGKTVQEEIDDQKAAYATIKTPEGFYKETFSDAVTFNIPSDYSNLQAAVDSLFNQTIVQGKKIILNIESGYKEKFGLKVQNGDFSKFYIQSVDSVVEVSDDFIGVVGPDGGATVTSGTVLMAYHARGPVLGCIFDGKQIARTLYFALGGSYGWSDRLPSSTEEAPNPVKIAGGKNFRHATFQAQEGSTIVCENAVATGCLLNSIYCERNSTIHAEFTDASGSTQAGVMATRGSRVNADTMNVSGCKFGMWASRGAVISAADSNADNCSVYGFYADMAATINAHNSSALNAGTNIPSDTTGFVNPGASYHAYRGSRINASAGKATGSFYGISAVIDSDVSAFGLIANQTKTIGITGRYTSRISVDNCVITGSIGRGILAADGASISANSGNIQGGSTVVGASTGGDVVVSLGQVKGGATGCYAETGGKITATGTTITGNSSFDIRINTGSIIAANGATYATTNTPVNAITSFGVIFA